MGRLTSISLINKLLGCLLTVGLFAFSAPIMAQPVDMGIKSEDGKFNEKAALKYSQDAIGRTVGDYTFTDSHGKTVKLSDFRGKPLVISLIYSSCVHTCPIITNTMNDAYNVASDTLDKNSFSMLTIGFDTVNDTSEHMRIYAEQNGVNGIENWKFLSTDATTIKNLSKDLGFIYLRSSQGFQHLNQTTIIDAKGMVYRQVYGDAFEMAILIDGLKKLVFGTDAPFSSIDNLVKSVRLFCTVYDQSTGTYYFDYSLFASIAGSLVVIIPMIIFIISNSRKIRRRREEAEKRHKEAVPS